MPEELNKCRDDINDIQRVMEESKLGEITYKSILDTTIFFLSYDKSKNYTLIYKDFKEYKICGLYLNKPQFEIDEKDNNLIHVKDNIKQLDGTIKVEEYIAVSYTHLDVYKRQLLDFGDDLQDAPQDLFGED